MFSKPLQTKQKSFSSPSELILNPHNILQIIPFALLFLGVGLLYSNYKNITFLSLGIIFFLVGLIWVGYKYKIKSVKLIAFGIITIACLFFVFGTLAYPLSRYSLEDRIELAVVSVLFGFLFYREIRKMKK